MQSFYLYPSRLQATGRRGEAKRAIRKWIRLSPFPLSHQPVKEIQRGNLRKKEKQMEVSQNRFVKEKRAGKQHSPHTRANKIATFDTNEI